VPFLRFYEHFLEGGNDTVTFIGIILLIGGPLLLTSAIRKTKGDLDMVDPQRRAKALKFDDLLATCGMILGGLGLLLLMLSFVLTHLWTYLE
jgi:hypothetical protein